MAWMKAIEIKPNSVYGKGSNFTKQWWRNYIRQVAAAGYIRRTIQTASFGTSNGVYASLTVTEKAKDAIAGEKSVLLPEFQMEKEISSVHSFTTNVRQDVMRKRRGKGCHMLSIVKVLLESDANWKEIMDKANSHFLGVFCEPSSNFVWYTKDVTELPHYTSEDPDFLWSDIQFSKRSSTKQIVEFNIGGNNNERCFFHRAQCMGVKKCSECVNMFFLIQQLELHALTTQSRHLPKSQIVKLNLYISDLKIQKTIGGG